ncbi:MAG: decaprenyl-phosphate phosphoribosyltransferase [Actinomycetota bacterium]|nr:decaprenyl-phosphate phosphoribosyltransferase [Actinomycetota bacterium]
MQAEDRGTEPPHSGRATVPTLSGPVSQQSSGARRREEDWGTSALVRPEKDAGAPRTDAGAPRTEGHKKRAAWGPHGGAPGSGSGGEGTSPAAVMAGLVRTMRPRQWVKNVLVLAAPAAAGVLTRTGPLLATAAAFAVFCAVASGLYLANDAFDAEADRQHPKKRNRPVAAGIVPRRLALVTGVVMVAAGIGASFAVAGTGLGLVVGLYAAVTLAYSAWLKHEPVVELAAVASGFVFRAIAGGEAAHVPISHWFLIVTSFGSLFMVTGKRYAEYMELGDERSAHRTSLAGYTKGFLASVRTMAAAVTLTAYCLWAFERASQLPGGAAFFELSILPFGLAILRYALLLEQGKGGAPEEVVLGDRRLQAIGAVWALVFALGVYAG